MSARAVPQPECGHARAAGRTAGKGLRGLLLVLAMCFGFSAQTHAQGLSFQYAPLPKYSFTVGETPRMFLFELNGPNSDDALMVDFTPSLPGWLTPEISDTNRFVHFNAMPTTTSPRTTYTMTVTRGSESISGTTTFSIEATATRVMADYLPSPMDQRATVGMPFSYRLDVVDPTGATYHSEQRDGTALPGWLTFNSNTRTFSGTPTAGDVGSFVVRVTADVPRVTRATSTFTLAVVAAAGDNAAPTAPAVTDRDAAVGSPFSYRFPRVDDPEAGPEGGTVTYTAALSGGGALPGWLSFDNAARTFSGTPPASAEGTVMVRVTATDNGTPPMSSMADFTITVQPAAAGPGPDDMDGMDDMDDQPTREEMATRAVTPEVARAVAANAVGAIAGRVSAAVSSSAVAGGFSFNGHATFEDAMAAHAQTMTDGGKDIKDLLNGADFVLPLNAAGDGSGASVLSLWGGGEYRSLGGEDRELDWDGDLFSAHLGVDGRLPNGMLAGAAVSWSESDLDYDLNAGGRGDYELDLTAIHPYLGWTSPDGLGNMWATLGFGQGDLEITRDGAAAGSDSDVDAMMAAVGGSREVSRNGGTAVRIKGEVLYSEMEVDASDDRQIQSHDVDGSRVRVSAEVSRPRTLADGARMAPSAEVGLRHDGGDGETGTGVEVGAGIVYTNPASGVTVEGRARALAGHSGDYDDWGVSGLIRLAPGADGQGLSFSVSPGYGDTISEVQKIWQQGLRDDIIADDDDDRDYGMRLDTRLDYGISAPDWWFGGNGMLTPYTGMTLGGSSDSYRAGLNWKWDTRFELDLVGEHRIDDGSTADPAENAVLLKGTVYF